VQLDRLNRLPYLQCIYNIGLYRMRVRISKWGNSLGIRIPKAFSLETGLAEGSEVDISVSGGRIVLTPLGREYGLEELADQITPENRHGETDWGKPVGREVV
jgi:antitoxin MazE